MFEGDDIAGATNEGSGSTAATGAAAGEGGAPAVAAGADEASQKRAAVAKAQRERRAEKKAEREEKERKRAEKKAKRDAEAASGEKPTATATATATAPATATPREGWPSDAAKAAQLPAALTLLAQVKFGLQNVPPLARYGAALEPRAFDVMQKDGTTREVTADPIADVLADPLAAMLAQSGANMTPGQALLSGCITLLLPVAMAHGAEVLTEWYERRQGSRREAKQEREVKANGAVKVQKFVPPPAPTPKAAAS